MAGVPDSIKAKAELTPMEDLALAVLRPALDPIPVQTLISFDQGQPNYGGYPFVLARRANGLNANRGGDPRFLSTGLLAVHCFAQDPNGDEDAAILSEVCRVALRDAWMNQTVYPGIGHISRFEEYQAPKRTSDWATATGPVQYADLPTKVHRYEGSYYLVVRKSPTPPYI